VCSDEPGLSEGIENRTYMYDTCNRERMPGMTGGEFERRLRRLGKRRGVQVRFVVHGKGSHGRIYFGARFTTLKDRRKEIGSGLLSAMCSQLGISPADL